MCARLYLNVVGTPATVQQDGTEWITVLVVRSVRGKPKTVEFHLKEATPVSKAGVGGFVRVITFTPVSELGLHRRYICQARGGGWVITCGGVCPDTN